MTRYEVLAVNLTHLAQLEEGVRFWQARTSSACSCRPTPTA